MSCTCFYIQKVCKISMKRGWSYLPLLPSYSSLNPHCLFYSFITCFYLLYFYFLLVRNYDTMIMMIMTLFEYGIKGIVLFKSWIDRKIRNNVAGINTDINNYYLITNTTNTTMIISLSFSPNTHTHTDTHTLPLISV